MSQIETSDLLEGLGLTPRRTVGLVSGSVWKSLTPVLNVWSGTITAAIAYVGSTGDTYLPLKAGSSVIVDASVAAVKAKATNPHTLLRWRRAGVAVYSLPNLHAKMLLAESANSTPPFVVVGSANASERSATTLHEAAVVTDAAEIIQDARNQLTEWKTRSTMLDALALTSLAGLYDVSPGDHGPSDFEPPVTDASSDSNPLDDKPVTDDDVDDLAGIAYQRPTQIYFMAVTTNVRISEEAMHQAEILADRYGASAPMDETDESPTELTVLRFEEYSRYPRSYAEGAHIVALYTQSKYGQLNAASVAGAPGRVVGRWIDENDDTHYYYLLSQKSSTEIRYPDVPDAFSGISMTLEEERGYLNPKVIAAVLDLWPDLRWR